MTMPYTGDDNPLLPMPTFPQDRRALTQDEFLRRQRAKKTAADVTATSAREREKWDQVRNRTMGAPSRYPGYQLPQPREGPDRNALSRTGGLGEIADDITRQAASAGLDVAGQFVEGTKRLVGNEEGARKSAAVREALQARFAPKTTQGQSSQTPLKLAANMAPYLAAGATKIPTIASAVMSGVQGQAHDGGLGAMAGMDPGAGRAAVDMGVDAALAHLPSLLMRGMRPTAQTLKQEGGLARDLLAEYQPGLSIKTVGNANRRTAPATQWGKTVVPYETMPGDQWGVEGAKELGEAYPRTRAWHTNEQLPSGAPFLEAVDNHFETAAEADKNTGDSFRTGLGSYKGDANMNGQLLLPKAHKDGTPVSKLEKDASAIALALHHRQNGVPWMTPTIAEPKAVMDLSALPPNEAAEAANAAGIPPVGMVVIPLARHLKAGEAEELAKTLAAANVQHNFTMVGRGADAHLIFGNLSGIMEDMAPVSDQQMLREIAGALNGNPVFEAVTPGEIRPMFGRMYSDYMGHANEQAFLTHLTEISTQQGDPAAGALATRLLGLFTRNADRTRSAQSKIDRSFAGGAVFDRDVRGELERLGQMPEPGLDAPYYARNLHPSMLQRGDPNVPLLTPEGKVPEPAVGMSATHNTVDPQIDAVDQAFRKEPTPLAGMDNYNRWASEIFGPVVPKPPRTVMELSRYADDQANGRESSPEVSAEYQRQLGILKRLDDPSRPSGRSTMGEMSDGGLEGTQKFGKLFRDGIANAAHSVGLANWSGLSARMSVAPHEKAFLDLYESGILQPAIDKAVRGEFTHADRVLFDLAAKNTLPPSSFSRSNSSGVNKVGKQLEVLSKNSAKDPTRNNAAKWHQLLTDPNLADIDLLREFQRNFGDESSRIGMDNKVAAFTGLVAGRKGNLVMDRVQTKNLWNANRDFPELASNFYEKSGVDGLMSGVQGYALQRAMQESMPKGVQQLYKDLGRAYDGLGRWHWESWVSESGQEVKHGSTSVLMRHAKGDPNPTEGVLIHEGQYDTKKYGGFQGRLNGEHVFGHTTTDGRMFVMDAPTFETLAEKFLKLLPKGTKITDAIDSPYWNLPGYPKEARDALIQQTGIEVPPPRHD